MDDKYANRGWLSLLLDPPDEPDDTRPWAAALLLDLLERRGETGGLRGYRIDTREATPMLEESMARALEALNTPERRLLVRTMLLMPWGLVRQSVGLSWKAPAVASLFEEAAAPGEAAEAAGDVIEAGREAITRVPLDGVLDEATKPGEGMVFEIDRKLARRIGTQPGRLEIDRVRAATQNFRPHYWMVNLRGLVPWWLDRAGAMWLDLAALRILQRVDDGEKGEETQYLLLGLADWAATRLDHPAADLVLGRARRGWNGTIRKSAVDLALLMGRVELLRNLAEDDPDAGVRKRAVKALHE